MVVLAQSDSNRPARNKYMCKIINYYYFTMGITHFAHQNFWQKSLLEGLTLKERSHILDQHWDQNVQLVLLGTMRLRWR